jgi:hypothetical protein
MHAIYRTLSLDTVAAAAPEKYQYQSRARFETLGVSELNYYNEDTKRKILPSLSSYR